ncbi:hypothetical protein B296_00003275 [Ensete ventricosum]|uniref:Uncharacterized protein n=1 Tax=Ensete ventricosum TaxID=4639 RepID=A0A427B8J1_ENSVE|nr:hypothetical protein B296_00003275 [Ensete ventricosum]
MDSSSSASSSSGLPAGSEWRSRVDWKREVLWLEVHFYLLRFSQVVLLGLLLQERRSIAEELE